MIFVSIVPHTYVILICFLKQWKNRRLCRWSSIPIFLNRFRCTSRRSNRCCKPLFQKRPRLGINFRRYREVISWIIRCWKIRRFCARIWYGVATRRQARWAMGKRLVSEFECCPFRNYSKLNRVRYGHFVGKRLSRTNQKARVSRPANVQDWVSRPHHSRERTSKSTKNRSILRC